MKLLLYNFYIAYFSQFLIQLLRKMHLFARMLMSSFCTILIFIRMLNFHHDIINIFFNFLIIFFSIDFSNMLTKNKILLNIK